MDITVLVTSIGSFSAESAIQSLKNHGCRVVGCDIHDDYLLASAGEVDVFYKIPISSDVELYINSLLNICKEEKIDYIFPLTDAEIDVLNDNRSIFDSKGITICMSGHGSIGLARNKYDTFLYLRDRGIIEIIETHPFEEIDPSRLSFPVIVKPSNGRSSQGIHVFESIEQIKVFQTGYDCRGYICQEKLAGNIVTVDVCRDKKNEFTTCLAREEFIRTSNGAGLSVHVFYDEELEESAKRIAEVLDVEGTVNFEYIKTDRGYRFVECNPRFSGGVAFSYIAGYDFVYNSLRYFMGEKIEPMPNIKDQYIVKKYVEIVTRCE